MNNLYFDDVVQIGKLYIEHVFYEFETEPVLFTCVDETKELYLCLCSDIRYGQKWIITKCDTDTLKALVEGEKDIASAFMIHDKSIIISMDMEGKENSYITHRENIDKLDLPKEGTLLKCNKEKAQSYLNSKKKKILFSEVVEYKATDYSFYRTLYYDVSANSFTGVLTIDNQTYDSVRQMERLTGVLEMYRKLAVVKQEYSVSRTVKYTEMTDKVNLCTDYKEYLYAA